MSVVSNRLMGNKLSGSITISAPPVAVCWNCSLSRNKVIMAMCEVCVNTLFAKLW